MKLATQDKPFFPSGLEEKFSAARASGFEAFEIDGALLVSRFEEVRTAMKNTGLPVSSVCGGYSGWIGDFDEGKRLRSVSDIGRILECAAAAGASGIVIPAAWGMFSLRLPPMVPPRNAEADRAALLDSLSRLEEKAAATGTLIYLEPLNRYEDHMLNTLADAASVIEAGRFTRVKLTADFFHMNIEEADIAASLERHAALVAHVHLSDSHRYQPGDGHTDFVSGFAALSRIGFSGVMAFECRVRGEKPEAEYRKSVAYIRDCIARAKDGRTWKS